MSYLSENVRKTVECANVELRGKVWIVVKIWMSSAFVVPWWVRLPREMGTGWRVRGSSPEDSNIYRLGGGGEGATKGY